MLDSSDENGLAYVETANLDGEKNLKLKQSKKEIRELIKKIGLENLKGKIKLFISSNCVKQANCYQRSLMQEYIILEEFLN